MHACAIDAACTWAAAAISRMIATLQSTIMKHRVFVFLQLLLYSCGLFALGVGQACSTPSGGAAVCGVASRTPSRGLSRIISSPHAVGAACGADGTNPFPALRDWAAVMLSVLSPPLTFLRVLCSFVALGSMPTCNVSLLCEKSSDACVPIRNCILVRLAVGPPL